MPPASSKASRATQWRSGSTAIRMPANASRSSRSPTPRNGPRPPSGSCASAFPAAPRFPASSPTAPARSRAAPSSSWSKATPPAAPPSRRATRISAIMPLRGKILNTWELEPGEIGSSQEVHDISVALGVDPGAQDLSQLRYHKICILADADSDGQHIATLLCALFLRHFRPLVVNGHVYVAMPPLYRIDAGKQVYYALDDGERDQLLKRIEKESPRTKPTVTRFKGLGEMNPAQLRETTIDPRTRRLVQLTIDGKDNTDQLMDMLLAKKRAGDRRDWLEQKGNLADVQV